MTLTKKSTKTGSKCGRMWSSIKCSASQGGGADEWDCVCAHSADDQAAMAESRVLCIGSTPTGRFAGSESLVRVMAVGEYLRAEVMSK